MTPYEQLAVAVDQIVNEDNGSWQDRKSKLMRALRDEGSASDLSEIMAWFADNDYIVDEE